LEKRYPSPETQVNEYRDAYLERFQLANTSLGGWRSDKGRVFILHGKPEDIVIAEDKEIWIYLIKKEYLIMIRHQTFLKCCKVEKLNSIFTIQWA